MGIRASIPEGVLIGNPTPKTHPPTHPPTSGWVSAALKKGLDVTLAIMDHPLEVHLLLGR